MAYKRKPCDVCGVLMPRYQEQGGHVAKCRRSLLPEKPWEEWSIARKRAKVMEDAGGFCAVCKNDVYNCEPIPLELDHIDGNADNNERSNLRALCPICHWRTPTYRGKNKGNGLKSRRQVYKDAYYRTYPKRRK